MMRRRSMHALLGTLALIAGCSTTHRTEVTGVVRDRATGRAIPGARVIGADGALARTDAAGRFTLYVRPGEFADVRVSADGHASEHVALDQAHADVELAATEAESIVIPTDDVRVLSWTEERWALDTWTSDGDVADGGAEVTSHCRAGDPSDGELGAGSACVSCHGEPTRGGPHARVADTCVACHGTAPTRDRGRAAGGTAATSCARCHGADEVGLAEWLADDTALRAARESFAVQHLVAESARGMAIATSCGGIASGFTQVGGAFVLVDETGSILGDCDDDRAPDDTERWTSLEAVDARLYARARAVASLDADRSHGAHDPTVSSTLLDTADR